LSQIAYPSGLTVNYIYDAVGNLSEIDNATGGNIWTGNTVNNLNQWTKFTLGNGIQTTIGYDQTTFMLSNIQATNKSSDLIQNLGYTFNAMGQLTQRTDATFSINSPLKEDFQYDGMCPRK
jgi:uncharacterized protein RhaS with RHS repeats